MSRLEMGGERWELPVSSPAKLPKFPVVEQEFSPLPHQPHIRWHRPHAAGDERHTLPPLRAQP
jgi:hypothetical protein